MAKGGTKILFGFLFFIVLTGGLAGGGAWYLTEERAEGYRATAVLLLEDGFGPIPLRVGGPHGDGPSPPGAPGPGIPPRDRLAHALGISAHPMPRPGIAAPDYATLFTTDAMAAQLKDALAESGASGLSLESVRDAMEAEAPVALQTRDNVVYRKVIPLHFTAETPELAAQGADAWATAAVDFGRKLGADALQARRAHLQETQQRLQTQIDEALARQAELQAESASVRDAQIALDLYAAAEALRAEVMALERDLARDEAALTVLKNHVSKAAVAVVLELSVKVAEMESSLAGARAELDYLKGRLAEAEAVPPSAATSIATHARSVEEVSRQLEALTPQLAAVEEQLAHVEGQPDPIRIASAPVTPESPVGPHRYVLVGGAALLGIVLGMIVYFGLLTLRVYARELDRA